MPEAEGVQIINPSGILGLGAKHVRISQDDVYKQVGCLNTLSDSIKSGLKVVPRSLSSNFLVRDQDTVDV